jgi:hypothetical protein
MGVPDAGTHSDVCGSLQPVFKPRKQVVAEILYNIYLVNRIYQ